MVRTRSWILPGGGGTRTCSCSCSCLFIHGADARSSCHSPASRPSGWGIMIPFKLLAGITTGLISVSCPGLVLDAPSPASPSDPLSHSTDHGQIRTYKVTPAERSTIRLDGAFEEMRKKKKKPRINIDSSNSCYPP